MCSDLFHDPMFDCLFTSKSLCHDYLSLSLSLTLSAFQGGHRPTLDPDVDLQVLASDEHCKGFS